MSNGKANFVITGSQFRGVSLSRDMKCTESCWLWPGIILSLLREFCCWGISLPRGSNAFLLKESSSVAQVFCY